MRELWHGHSQTQRRGRQQRRSPSAVAAV